jgi:hypothetical protein
VYTEPSHSSGPVVAFCSMPLYSSSGHIVGGKHVMHELASFAGQLWQAELWLRTNTVLDSVLHNRLWAACTSGPSRVLFNQPLHVMLACRLYPHCAVAQRHMAYLPPLPVCFHLCCNGVCFLSSHAILNAIKMTSSR